VDLRPVRAAYSAVAQQYVDVFGGDVATDEDAAFVRRHLAGLGGPVLDLGCGPGQWTAYLHALGTDVSGVDLVPEFIAHARAAHPGPEFRLGSMTDVDVPAGSVAGVLSWYSTIHLPPAQLDDVLTGFRRLLAPGGVLVLGFFDSEDDVSAFDHAVVTAYRWPVDVLVERLEAAGFTEVQRQSRPSAERPDRRFAAVAARAT
jgi:SAM-dependent methyltransferase